MSKISEKFGYDSIFGKRSLFAIPEAEGLFDGYVNFTSTLYPLGAAIYNAAPSTEKTEVLDTVEISAKRVKFDYRKHINKNLIKRSYVNQWEHKGRTHYGRAILNKRIDYLDAKKIFIQYNGLSFFKNSKNFLHPLGKNLIFTFFKPYQNDKNTGSFSIPNIEYLQQHAAIQLNEVNLEGTILIIKFLEEGSADASYVQKLKYVVAKTIKKELLDPESDANKNIILSVTPSEYLHIFTTKELNTFYNDIVQQFYLNNIDEKAIINLLETLVQKRDFNATKFLTRLLKNKIKGQIEFERLYDKMNDYGGENNFSALIITLYKIWYISDYNNAKNKAYVNYISPPFLSYTQKKILGYRFDDYDFSFDRDANIVLKTETITYDSIPEIIVGEIIQYYDDGVTYHPFQPLELTELSETKNEELLLEEGIPIPAFYLKAFDDKGAWENFEKNVWLAVDILSTFTGIGNLLKFRNLISVGNKAYVALKLAFGVVEVATGVIAIALNFVDKCEDKAFCKKLRQYLFWLEICTLGADVLTSKILRKQAQETKEALENFRKTRRNKKDIEDISLLQKHLDDIIDDNLDISPFIKSIAKILPKSSDNVSKFVKEAEATILKKASEIKNADDQLEYAFIWNNSKNGFKNKIPFTSGEKGAVKISDAFGIGTKINEKRRLSLIDAIVTHNHPNFTRFSNDDIKMFLKYQFKELRAVNTNGITYSLKLKPNTKFTKEEFTKLYKELAKEKAKFAADKLLNTRSFDDKVKFAYELQDFEEEFVLNAIKNKIEYNIFK